MAGRKNMRDCSLRDFRVALPYGHTFQRIADVERRRLVISLSDVRSMHITEHKYGSVCRAVELLE